MDAITEGDDRFDGLQKGAHETFINLVIEAH
jgi:hypothetical protein